MESILPLVVAASFVLGGLVLLFAGATLSSYGVGLLGLVLGAGGGYLVGPSMGAAVGLEGTIAIAVAILAGGAIGIVLTYALLSIALAATSFVVGTFLGLSVFAPALVDGAWYVEWGVAVGVGILAAFVGLFMTRTTMVLLTSLVGAALASRSITVAELEAAQAAVSVRPLLFDLSAPLFLGLFVLGVLTQVGLFKLGYATKVLGLLPGATLLRDRGRERAGG